MGKLPYIIAIDDTPYNLEVLKMIFMDLEIELACVHSGDNALKLIKKRQPDLILLDIVMPEMDGYEVCNRLKNNTETSAIPIIFLSALDSIDDKMKAFESGAVDYITKPFNTLEVLARVKTHLKLYNMLEEMNTLLRESFHEIYTPLGLIKSSLSLQKLEQGDSEHLENISASVHSLHSIYEDIYYAVKKEVKGYPKEWIDLESFLEKRIKLFKPLMYHKNLTCKIVSSVDSPMMHISITELERLIDNILSNAIKYALKESEILINIQDKEDKIQLSIANHSKTIQDPKKLFEKLYREDTTVMGLGIGLSIVKNICDRYKIDIDVTSENNITSFTLVYKEKA